MTEPVIFPDAEQLVIEHLIAQIAMRSEAYAQGVGVTKDVPDPRPEKFITVRRVGGISSRPVPDHARIDVQSWHVDDQHAQDLCQLSRGLLRLMVGSHQIDDSEVVCSRVIEFTGPVRFPDPDSHQARWLLTIEADIRRRGAAPQGS